MRSTPARLRRLIPRGRTWPSKRCPWGHGSNWNVWPTNRHRRLLKRATDPFTVSGWQLPESACAGRRSPGERGDTMGQPITQVDAFTTTPFAGNPAAVCMLSEPGNEGWMQQVASEMNLAETAFLYRQED